MRSDRVPAQPCPWCGKKLDAAASVDREHPPVEGDITVCLYCEGCIVFGAGLGLARLLRAERRALPAAKRRHLERVLGLVRRSRPARPQ
jgi:hypothetical protein